MIAAIRPDAWGFPLFLHVAGAMLLVGALVVVVATMAGALRRGEGAQVLSGLAFRTLLIGVFPAYILMRAGSEWIASKENVPDDVDWIGIGYARRRRRAAAVDHRGRARVARVASRRRRPRRAGPRGAHPRGRHDRRLRRRDLGHDCQARVATHAIEQR